MIDPWILKAVLVALLFIVVMLLAAKYDREHRLKDEAFEDFMRGKR